MKIEIGSYEAKTRLPELLRPENPVDLRHIFVLDHERRRAQPIALNRGCENRIVLPIKH